MSRKLVLAVLVGVISLTGANTSHANPKIYEKTLTSSAWIFTAKSKTEIAWGSGVVIDVQKKWVLTNSHVIPETGDIVVFFPVNQNSRLVVDPNYYLENAKTVAISAILIERDKQHDLALLELKSLPAGVQAIVLANASPNPGETLHTIGNSGASTGALWRYSRGEVRQVYQTTFKSTVTGGKVSQEVKATIVETQMPINPGDSGGAVVNDLGQLVAVNQSFIPGYSLVSRGIDITEIRAFLRTAASEEARSHTIASRRVSIESVDAMPVSPLGSLKK
jgi:serine protease Do